MTQNDTKKELIAYLVKEAAEFAEMDYFKTSKEILSIVEERKRGVTLDPIQLDERLKQLSIIISQEFIDGEGEDPRGRKYRNDCYNESVNVIASAELRLREKFKDAISSVGIHFARKLDSILRNLYPLMLHRAEFFTENESMKERNIVLFHLDAYCYLILYEGVFDELVRLFFFFTTVSRTNVLAIEVLNLMEVRNIIAALKNRGEPMPIFLEN